MLMTLTKCILQIFVVGFCLIELISGNVNLNSTTPCTVGKPKNSFDEFIFEHQVTTKNAIIALKQLNDTFLNGPRSPGCKAIPCTVKVMKYCLGSQFLNDHCWCEQGHSKEGLPWVPHTCYVGDKHYAPSVGSCFLYSDVKECCCEQALFRRWRFLSGAIGCRMVGSKSSLIWALGLLTFLKLVRWL